MDKEGAFCINRHRAESQLKYKTVRACTWQQSHEMMKLNPETDLGQLCALSTKSQWGASQSECSKSDGFRYSHVQLKIVGRTFSHHRGWGEVSMKGDLLLDSGNSTKTDLLISWEAFQSLGLKEQDLDRGEGMKLGTALSGTNL